MLETNVATKDSADASDEAARKLSQFTNCQWSLNLLKIRISGTVEVSTEVFSNVALITSSISIGDIADKKILIQF